MPRNNSTNNLEYAKRLENIQEKWWKKAIRFIDPYKRNINNLKPGFCLDIGCGLGRNLNYINGHGVGLDHNENCVEACLSKGFIAYSPSEFKTSKYAEGKQFDSILLSHVAEHMKEEEVVHLISEYLVYLKQNGKVILITPQERGQNSDLTHVAFMDFSTLSQIGEKLLLSPIQAYSHPFPRCFGPFFIYNEFIWVGQKKVI